MREISFIISNTSSTFLFQVQQYKFPGNKNWALFWVLLVGSTTVAFNLSHFQYKLDIVVKINHYFTTITTFCLLK